MSEIKLYHPAEIDQEEWRQLQAIQWHAFTSSLDRTSAEIDALIDWDDPVRFMASHVDPNTEVGKRFNPNQSYTNPRVAIAIERRETIGFAYSAHNVSGASGLGRIAKKLSVIMNYLWVREIAVLPEYQNDGVAKELGRALLKDAINLQPVTAFVWPGEDAGFTRGTLERLGFSPTGEQQVKVFGADSQPIRQLRMEAPTVRGVLRKL